MFKSLSEIQIPILTKITVPYVILAVIIAAGGSYIITRVIVDSVEERFTNQLIETGLLASEGVVREEEELLRSLRLLSHLQGVPQAVDDSQIDTLNQLLLPAAYNSEIEAFAILNRFGRQLLAVHLNPDGQIYENLVPMLPLAEAPFLESILRAEQDEFGDKYAGFVATHSGTFLFAAGPIQTADGSLVGVALVGRSQEALTRTLREETLAQLSLYDLNGDLRTSTLEEGYALDGQSAQLVVQRQEEGSLAREIEDIGITYKELLLPLEIREGRDLGILGVALPTSFLVQTSEITRTNTILLMTGVVFLVIVVGVYVAGRITRPILDLKEAAQQVAEGNLSVRVDRSGRDEVGVLANSFNEMVNSISQSKRDLINAHDRTIEGWALALDLRDHETEGHSRRVANLAVKLAVKMGVAGQDLENLRRGALLHDIGKIAVPDSILLKRGKLTAKQRETMKRHPELGKEFMERIEFLRPALDIPFSHHERWDGTGYPKGLKGKNIPLPARIFAVVDVWDAITADRPYRKAMPLNKALKIIEEESGKHFDPKVVKAFLDLLDGELKQKDVIT